MARVRVNIPRSADEATDRNKYLIKHLLGRSDLRPKSDVDINVGSHSTYNGKVTSKTGMYHFETFLKNSGSDGTITVKGGGTAIKDGKYHFQTPA